MRWIALQALILTEPAPALMSDAAAQRAMACIALGFTPRVALVDEAVLMEVSGSLRLFGGLLKLVALLEERLKQFFESNSLPAQVIRAQGATSLIALGRLRFSRQASASVPKRVADLPMHTLSAAHPHLGVLERTGCRTWDDLLRLPRDGVARRFGAELLASLDRARGALPDNYDWLTLPEQFDEKLALDALVIHTPALMHGVERLLASLQAWLLGRQSGLSALKITWHLDKRRDVAPTGELEIRTAQPAQDLRHVARLIAERLGQQSLPAPVHSLSLQSLATELLLDSAAATGSLLMEERKQGDGALELIERLSARLGEAQVQVWQARASHRPEQMQRWLNAADAENTANTIKLIAGDARITWAGSRKGLKEKANGRDSTKTEALYPTWLLPQPIKLATVGNSPVYQGKLTRLAGPQRLEASGWLMSNDIECNAQGRAQNSAQGDIPPAIRDYFIYRSQQASLLWIYSERLAIAPTTVAAPAAQRAWYLHGFFA